MTTDCTRDDYLPWGWDEHSAIEKIAAWQSCGCMMCRDAVDNAEVLVPD